MNVHESLFGWIFPEFRKSVNPEIFIWRNLFSIDIHAVMCRFESICPQGHAVFRGGAPEASHGRQPRSLIPEDPRNIAAENPPVIFRFGAAFSREELSFANAGTVPVA